MKFINFILDFVYPPVCINCKTILNTFSKERYICKKCKNNFEFLDIIGCKICGRSTGTDKEFCNICEVAPNISFNKNYSLFPYDDVYKSFIYKLKYGLDKRYSYLMSMLMYEYIIQNNLFKDIDIITCVPMHKSKERKRGFNQSALLAKQLSSLLNIPYKQTLIRNKNTVPQSSLRLEDRFKNLSTVFVLNKNTNVSNKNILIIDDIYTSGATISECSNQLIANEAKNIYALTFCLTRA